MLKRLAASILLCAILAPIASATSYSPRLGLLLMSTGTPGWGIRLNNEVFSVIDTSAAWLTKSNTFVSSNTFLAGELFVNSAITMTGPGGTFLNNSSVTTNGGFFGPGWGITNLSTAAFPSTLIFGTGTANQFAYFDAPEHLTSTGAFTVNGTTIRFGNLGTPLPTSDMHVVMGDGARAFNINLSEDPVYLEIAAGAGAQAAIGFSVGGNKKYRLGKTPHGNFALIDHGAGEAVIYVEDGTSHVAIGRLLASDDIFADTQLNLYGVMTFRGTGASQNLSTNENGTIYFDQGNGFRSKHFMVSENNNSYKWMLQIATQNSVAGAIPYIKAATQEGETTVITTSAFVFNGSSLTLKGAALFLSTVTALNFSGSGSLLTGVIHTGDAAGGDVSGTFPTSLTIPTLSALGISSNSAQVQITALGASTATESAARIAGFTAIGASTAALSALITANGVAIATNAAVIGQLSVSTASLASSIVADRIAIATNSFVISQLTVSTISLQSQINANTTAIATNSFVIGQLTVSTVSLAASIAANTTAIATNSAVIGQLSASTQTLASSIVANATAISTNSFVIGQLTVSTISLQAQISALNFSGKASSGTNADITSLTALTTISHSFTVPGPSSATFNNVLALSSNTGNHFGSGYGLNNIIISSCTSIPNTTFSNTSFGPAISTITIPNIRAGSHVRVTFSGSQSNNSANANTAVTILQDGAFTLTIGNAAITSNTGTTLDVGNFSFDVVLDTPALTAGSHSWAFAPDVSAGTGTLIKTATSNNRFCVTEEP